MMIQFLVPHVQYLAQHGFRIEIACSDVGGRMNEIRVALGNYVKKIHVVRLERSPISIKNFLGLLDMKKIIKKGHYDFIWTNEPVMGVITRLAAIDARKHGTKVFYMVHGFHFFRGAPKKYWIAFWPIEMFMSNFTDTIVTINKEDYCHAKHMHAGQVKYIHGIGVDTDRLNPSAEQKDIRKELGLPANSFLVLSVGELNKNKNQKVVIQAIGKLHDPQIHYILCGKGPELKNLKMLARDNGVEDHVHFLGYRTDVVDICSQANIFMLPSHREGLPVASLEAMYAGLPLITSRVRGIVDFMENGVTGYMCSPDDVNSFANAIVKTKNNIQWSIQGNNYNKRVVKPFLFASVKKEVLQLFM